MQGENTFVNDLSSAALVARGGIDDRLTVLGYYTVECIGEDGELKWSDIAWNVVTTEGKNAMLDKFLGLGAAYAAIAMGLHTTVGNASSTYATPSPQVESVVYSNPNRPTPSFSAASAGAKATSAAVAFNINGSATITGCFMALGAAGVTTKSDTAATAILLSSGTFSGGSRSVISGDTLNVSYTLTLT
ncbi:MAG TPA: hypothetical protein PLU52_11605 [Opitutaceae bacterium]|nr:hypothetical protein [Opitutaceae bacterium]